jgi:HSP20 family protein
MEKENNEEGVFGLGGLFKGIEKLVDLAGKLEGQGGIAKEGEIKLDQIKKGMSGTRQLLSFFKKASVKKNAEPFRAPLNSSKSKN